MMGRAGLGAAVALLGGLLCAGCGLQPLYADGARAPVATQLTQVEVTPIEGRTGWFVANALRDRLGIANRDGDSGGSGARYRLDVRLDDEIEGLGLLRDNTITRERRVIRARYQLVDQTSDAVLLDATTGSDAGIDVVSSEYAVIAAEQSASERLAQVIADRIVTRVALALRDGGAATASAPAAMTPADRPAARTGGSVPE